MERSRQMVEVPAQRVGHGLRLVVVVEAGQIAPARIASQLDQPGPEFDAEGKPPKENQDQERRRRPVVAQEDGQESGLEQERFPTERVPALPDVDDAQIEHPQDDPGEHRDGRRSQLRQAEHYRGGEDAAEPSEGDGQPVRVVQAEQGRRIAESRRAQEFGHRQQPVLTEQRPELMDDGREREQVDGPEQALEDLPRQPVAGKKK